jgi:hypothetical protein
MKIILKVLAAKAPWLVSAGLIVASSLGLSQCFQAIQCFIFGCHT